MELTLQTPSLLFPAISLLMLAFTNRFLSLAKLIRDLYTQYEKSKEQKVFVQIKSLRVICMFFIFNGQTEFAKYIFQLSLLLLIISLSLSVWEVQISTNALSVQLSDMEDLNLKK